MTQATVATRRLSAVLRAEERGTPRELFFDLVFVLAITQCTALMADEPTWSGLAKGLAVLALLWWCWGGYAWLTSVVDPEEGAVRIVIFGAMASLLVAALCVPAAFDDSALIFACAYGAVRIAHILLFVLASRDDPGLRYSVLTLATSTTLGVGLLTAAAFTDGWARAVLWAVALLFDISGPAFFGVEGWRLVPGHFAERHGLIIIIAIGESIVAIGVSVAEEVNAGIIAAAAAGTVVAAGLWWLYFDVVARVAERRLQRATPGREQNSLARDSYSYLHYPMVAGIVLVALGMKKTIGDVGEPLKLVPAAALFGGTAVYLLAHVAFRLRNLHTVNRQRLLTAVVMLALIPVAVELPALASVVVVAALLSALIAYEAVRFAEARDRIRHELVQEAVPE